VEVYNTAMNPGRGRAAARHEGVAERYGQRTRLQDLDGLKPLPSGLLSAPRLVAEK